MTDKDRKQLVHVRLIRRKSCHLLYNPERLPDPDACLLNARVLELASHRQPVENGGRGRAWFLQLGDVSAVYRQYQRGGLIAKINQQTYFDFNLQKTRSFSEWNLLKQMYEQGLPVPPPIAASVYRWPFPLSPFYRAQILVERIADAQTLDQRLTKQAWPEEQWLQLGQCIRRFHVAGIYHADLNANNILLDKSGKIYLIDFDKGEHRPAGQKNTAWMQENIQRLKRSLLKLQSKSDGEYFFSENLWESLLNGYTRE